MEEKKIVVKEELKEVKDVASEPMIRTSFVKLQGVDAEAAFQRMTITKEMLRRYQAAINSTNTIDVVGRLEEMYDDLEVLAKAIIKEEQLLISIGE